MGSSTVFNWWLGVRHHPPHELWWEISCFWGSEPLGVKTSEGKCAVCPFAMVMYQWHTIPGTEDPGATFETWNHRKAPWKPCFVWLWMSWVTCIWPKTHKKWFLQIFEGSETVAHWVPWTINLGKLYVQTKTWMAIGPAHLSRHLSEAPLERPQQDLERRNVHIYMRKHIHLWLWIYIIMPSCKYIYIHIYIYTYHAYIYILFIYHAYIHLYI